MNVLCTTGWVSADIFVTRAGDKIEGELIEERDRDYRLRTRMGVIDLPKERVEKIIKKASPWARYTARRKSCPNTADAHYELAKWCKGEKLDAEYRDELKRAIELDPDHAAAREELGYRRNKKGDWFAPKSGKGPTADDVAARRAAAEEERLLRKLVTNWFVKVKAIHKGRLSRRTGTPRREKFAEGREQILAIRDPLAIPAITGVLSTGSREARLLMVEALAEFEEDEATMNLLVASILDPSLEVRTTAAAALVPRKDKRIVNRLMSALYSEEEVMLRNAATALGVLKAHSAVDDLIGVLSKEIKAKVQVSRPVYLDGVRSEFGGYYQFSRGQQSFRYQPAGIGCLGPGSMVGTVTATETQIVTIHRTEVQEALIAITGQNFGFDVGDWRDWWLKNEKRD